MTKCSSLPNFHTMINRFGDIFNMRSSLLNSQTQTFNHDFSSLNILYMIQIFSFLFYIISSWNLDNVMIKPNVQKQVLKMIPPRFWRIRSWTFGRIKNWQQSFLFDLITMTAIIVMIHHKYNCWQIIQQFLQHFNRSYDLFFCINKRILLALSYT